ncbi:MAG: hypothetical protein JWM68_4736 [Verrucomicrobiales bacterium]|nr:hypothetical protein [Verrucomicrobiales bacterium]
MKNEISKSIPALLTMAGLAANGAGQYAALPLLQNTQANINADINALTDAIMAYGTGKDLLSVRRDAMRVKGEIGRGFLTLGRDNFKPILGSEYNQSWDNTGLVGSLVIPRTELEVLPVLHSYKQFMTANPTFEVESKDITATAADALHTQLGMAIGAVKVQEGINSNLLAERDVKAANLRKRMSDLIAELKMRLPGLDGRWKGFGFNPPDAQETPDGVGAVTAVLIGPNTAALKWAAPARAEYYHVFKRVVGVDADFVLVGSPADLDFNLENLPAGSHVDIVVSAVNNGGEGQRSEVVTLVTH